jgi:hypothetical protein
MKTYEEVREEFRAAAQALTDTTIECVDRLRAARRAAIAAGHTGDTGPEEYLRVFDDSMYRLQAVERRANECRDLLMQLGAEDEAPEA